MTWKRNVLCSIVIRLRGHFRFLDYGDSKNDVEFGGADRPTKISGDIIPAIRTPIGAEAGFLKLELLSVRASGCIGGYYFREDY